MATPPTIPPSPSEDNAKRGQRLVDEARPELRALSDSGGYAAVTLDLRNEGKDAARNVTMRFSGMTTGVNVGHIPRGSTRITPSLNIAGAPFLTNADVEMATIEVFYEDQYGTLYTLTLPVSRQKRADGNYNVVIA